MTLEEIFSKLPQEHKEDAKSVILAAIEEERQKGIAAKSEVNREAQGLRTRLHTYEGPLKEVFGDQIPEDWHTQLKGMKESTGKLTEKEKLLAGMSEETKLLMKKLADLEKTTGILSAEREALQKEKITNLLQDSLRKHIGGKVYNEDLTIKGLMLDGTVSYDEQNKVPVWRSGEKVIAFEDGVKEFMSKADVRVQQKQGAGGAGSGAPSSGPSEAASVLASALRVSGRSHAS